MLKSKDELKENLINVLQEFKYNKETVNKIKKGMKEFKVLPGKVQTYINNASEHVPELDADELFLLTEATYKATAKPSIDPKLYFTERETKEIITNFEGDVSEKVEFPYTFKFPAIKITDNNYILNTTASEIKYLYDHGLLQYNQETQREGRQIKKNDEIIVVPKVIEKSVKEIKELLKKGEAIVSMITLNARIGSAEEGEEIEYNEQNGMLTITKGSLLDILDGFHRVNGIVRALREDPSLDAPFILNVLNYGKKQAQKHFAQQNTTNPISTSHLKKMSETRQSDFIAKQVQMNSELSGKVAAGDRIAPESNLLVTFNTLSDAINEVYNIEDRATAIKTSRYLTEFINELFFSFPEQFLGDISEARKTSLMPANSMFFGYFVLSKKMKEQDIKLEKLSEILSGVDFSRDNEMWKKLGVLDNDNRITQRAKNEIKKYFENLDLTSFKEGVSVG